MSLRCCLCYAMDHLLIGSRRIGRTPNFLTTGDRWLALAVFHLWHSDLALGFNIPEQLPQTDFIAMMLKELQPPTMLPNGYPSSPTSSNKLSETERSIRHPQLRLYPCPYPCPHLLTWPPLPSSPESPSSAPAPQA